MIAYRVVTKIEYIRIFYKIEMRISIFYSQVITCRIMIIITSNFYLNHSFLKIFKYDFAVLN